MRSDFLFWLFRYQGLFYAPEARRISNLDFLLELKRTPGTQSDEVKDNLMLSEVSLNSHLSELEREGYIRVFREGIFASRRKLFLTEEGNRVASDSFDKFESAINQALPTFKIRGDIKASLDLVSDALMVPWITGSSVALSLLRFTRALGLSSSRFLGSSFSFEEFCLLTAIKHRKYPEISALVKELEIDRMLATQAAVKLVEQGYVSSTLIISRKGEFALSQIEFSALKFCERLPNHLKSLPVKIFKVLEEVSLANLESASM